MMTCSRSELSCAGVLDLADGGPHNAYCSRGSGSRELNTLDWIVCVCLCLFLPLGLKIAGIQYFPLPSSVKLHFQQLSPRAVHKSMTLDIILMNGVLQV